MAKTHGGKRPGSGRKPKKAGAAPTSGSKSSNFSTRITQETRDAIELAASGTHLSVSAMAQHLLLLGLKSKRDAQLNGPTRAICYLLGELAEIVAPKQLKTEQHPGDWRNDPFLFETLKLSFVKMMDAVRPTGEVISPAERDPQLKGTTLWGPLELIDARADYAATILLHNLNAAREPKDMLQHVPAGIEKKVLDTPYALHDAWKGLNERTGK